MTQPNDQTPRLCQCSDALRYEDINKHEPGCPRLTDVDPESSAEVPAVDSTPEAT